MLERARHMIAIAAQALADLDVGPKPGFRRFVRREPLGVVLTVAAWNYPYLIAVNSVVPALMAGNVVLLKHSAQTPLCAERFAECLAAAGLPEGVFTVLHLSPRRHRLAGARPARRLRRLHRLGGRRPRGAACRQRALHRHRPRARRLRPGLRARTTPISPTRSRTSSTARTSIRASPAAASSASTCTRGSMTTSSTASIALTRTLCARRPAAPGDHARTGGAHRPRPRRYVARSRPRSRRARNPRIDGVGVPCEPAGHAIPRAAGAARRRSLDAGDARGDLRSGGRHHEGEFRRARRSR